MIVEVERDAIVQALIYTHGDKTRAAGLLGISYSSVYRKIDSYDIQPHEYIIGDSSTE